MTEWEPMLAHPASTFPPRDAGRLRFEPKWDGYRGILVRGDDACLLWSRNGVDLTGCFPDVAEAACRQVAPGTVLDGELVVWHEGRVDFAALTPRLAYRTGGRVPAAVPPASFLAFDLLRVGGVDQRAHPLRARRAELEALGASWRPPLQLTPQTDDVELAQQWFADYAAVDVGVEGLVVKAADQAYRPGRRGWVKLRIRHTREAVVGAVTGSLDDPERLVLGLRDEAGKLRVAGATHPLSRAARAEVAALLSPATPDHPWPVALGAPHLGRFERREVEVIRVQPTLVVEVDADGAFEHGRWRHPTRFVRVRRDVTWELLPPLAG